MTVKLYESVDGDGLFDLLGKVFFAQQTMETAADTTIPAELLDILTQYEKFSDDIELTSAIADVTQANDSITNLINSPITIISQVASNWLVEMVHDDNPQANRSLQLALEEIIDQMTTNSESVDASTVTTAIADVGTPAGDGEVIATIKRGDGLNQENMYAEVIAAEAISDGPNASLSFISDASEPLLSVDWPAGSGIFANITSTEPSSSLILNGDMEDEDDIPNAPDDWIVSVGVIGTTVKMTDVEVQTISIGGTPTGGHYRLSFTNSDGDVQTTDSLAFDASGAAIQAALRELTGLEEIAVATTGDTPNVVHTVTFTGIGGNLTVLSNTNNLTGGGAVNEVQRITVTGTPASGTFTLTYSGQTTAAIAYDATATVIDAALEALSNIAIGDTVTTGGPLPGSVADVEFAGALAATDVVAMTINTSSLAAATPGVTIATFRQGGSATNEVQTLSLTGTPSGGTFTLTYGGQTTGALTFDDISGDIQSALEALSTVGSGNVACTGGALPGADVVITFQGTLAATDVAKITGTSSLTGGSFSAAITTPTPGTIGPNELRQWQAPWAHGGYFLMFNGESSGVQFALSDTAETVQTAMQSLSTIGAGNMTVTGAHADAFIFEFTGTFASADVPANHRLLRMIYSAPQGNAEQEAGTIQNGGVGTDEVQRITIAGTPTAGTFTLTYAGQTTGLIAFDATASDVQAALILLSGIASGDMACTGGPLPGSTIDCTFQGTLASTDVAEMTINETDGMEVAIEETAQGDAGTNETETVVLTNSPSGGTFTLTYGGQTTGGITYDATAAQVQNELDALSSIGVGDVDCTGGPLPSTTVTIEFKGALAATNVTEITASAAGLTAAAIAGTITTVTEGSPSGGSISHATVSGGTTEVFEGGKALILDSDGAELTTLQQRIDNLEPETAYAFSLWAISDVTPAAGVITCDLIDGIAGTVIQDKQSVNNTFTFNAADLTQSWKHLDALVSGEIVFRTPTVVPDIVYLRVRISTAVSSGTSVFLDALALTKMTELYSGGPLVAVFSGSKRFRKSDEYTLTTTNDRAGLVQEWANRNFQMAQLGLLFPSDAGASETVPDTVVS